MLFCFGLFALLLYNTVVANAECSYTYRNRSHQHIEAQSSDYERQGFRRCEFLIQLGDSRHQIELNFTRLSGFGPLHTPSSHQHDLQEGTSSEKEEEEEEEEGAGGRVGGGGRQEEEKRGGGGVNPSPHPGVVTPSSTRGVVVGSKLSSMVSSPSPPREQQQHSPHVYANVNASSQAVVVGTPSPSSSLLTTTTSLCLPVVEIREVTGEGEEKTRHRICRQHHNTQTPIVFHYASSVRIVYEWKQKQSSGFTLYYEKCVHKCDGTRCLTEAGLLCNGQADCRDRSDEGSPACPLSTSVSTSHPLGAGQLAQIVVIPTSLVLVGLVVCVVCLLARHRWSGAAPSSASSLSSPSDGVMHPHHHLHPHHNSHHQHQNHHQHHHLLRGNGHAAVHLDCPPSHSSEGLTPSGCSGQDCFGNEQAVALLPSNNTHHHHQQQQQQHQQQHRTHHKHPPPPPTPEPEMVAPPVDLPPNIPVSPDGEEGYSASQMRLLDCRSRATAAAPHQLFKPPPNKTVFDRESPPPYSSLTPSSSGSYYGFGGGGGGGGGWGGGGSPLAPSPPSPPHSVGRGYLLGEAWSSSSGGVGGGPQRVVRDSEGQAVVSRCYTMFSGPSSRPHLPHPRPHRGAAPPPPPPPSSSSSAPIAPLLSSSSSSSRVPPSHHHHPPPPPHHPNTQTPLHGVPGRQRQRPTVTPALTSEGEERARAVVGVSGGSSSLCDASAPAPASSSVSSALLPAVLGAFTTTAAEDSVDLLSPSSSSPSSSSSHTPFLSPPPGDPPPPPLPPPSSSSKSSSSSSTRPMPSSGKETVLPSWSSSSSSSSMPSSNVLSSSSVVGFSRDSDRDPGVMAAGGGVGAGGVGETPLTVAWGSSSPPSYQMVLSQDLQEGRRVRGAGMDSPRVTSSFASPPSSSSSASSSAASTATTNSTCTSVVIGNNNNSNSNGDCAGV